MARQRPVRNRRNLARTTREETQRVEYQRHGHGEAKTDSESAQRFHRFSF